MDVWGKKEGGGEGRGFLCDFLISFGSFKWGRERGRSFFLVLGDG